MDSRASEVTPGAGEQDLALKRSLELLGDADE